MKELKFTGSFLREELKFDEIDTIELNGVRHYKTPFGNFPSVTTILGSEEKEVLKHWANAVGPEHVKWTLQEASQRGSEFHDTVEKYLKNETISINNLMLKHHFLQVKSFFDRNFNKIVCNEIPLFSKKMRVAGRCDCVAELNGIPHIVDFKTSRRLKEESEIENYFMQCSAYSFILEEMFGLTIPNFCIIISNIEVNFPTIVYGNRKHYIKKFIELRVRYEKGIKNAL